MLRIFMSFCICPTLVCGQDSRYCLNILHYNDFHARFVETNTKGGVCEPEKGTCIGGFARLTTKVRERLAAEPDSLLLNAGDSFQGTIWYNILRWNVTQEFMNILPHDAHVLGNHDFDNGVAGVVPYLQHLKQPVVTANIIDIDEPTLKGLYKHSIVVTRRGQKIGIIGVIVSNTHTLAATGKLKFTDEVTAVRTEASKLEAKGVKIIIVLSHCGIDVDRKIAINGGPYIDIIVGGHSHTLLYNKPAPTLTYFKPNGPYPVVEQIGNRKVLIVQAAAHAQFLGEIKLYFDENGTVIEWKGEPHFLGPDTKPAADILTLINKYYPIISEKSFRVVGTTLTDLAANCFCSECNLGDVICDAFLDSVLSRKRGRNWHYAHFSVYNSGGIRSLIPRGSISFAAVLMAMPFENNVEVFDLRGDFVLEMLELSVANVNVRYPGSLMLQVSGLRAVINGSLPVNSRVVNVSVRCIECDIPRYYPLRPDKYYKVVSQSFLGNGGNGYTLIPKNRKNVEVIGVEYEVLSSFITRHSPVLALLDGRLQISNPCIVSTTNTTSRRAMRRSGLRYAVRGFHSRP